MSATTIIRNPVGTTLVPGTGAQSVSFGKNSKAVGAGGVAVGQEQSVQASSVSIGKNNVTSPFFPQSVAVGVTALNSIRGDVVYLYGGLVQTSTILIGAGTQTGSQFNIAIGYLATALGGSDAVAIGYNSVSQNQGLALGTFATAGDVAVGSQANAASGAIAIGNQASAPTSDAIAIGRTAAANAGNSLALGDQTQALAGASMAIGVGAIVGNASNSVALGSLAHVNDTSANSVAIGRSSSIGTGSSGGTAIGKSSVIPNGTGNCTVIGEGATATAIRAIAVGFGVSASLQEAIFGPDLNEILVKGAVLDPLYAHNSPAADGDTGLFIIGHTSGAPVQRQVTLQAPVLGQRLLQVAA